MAPVFYCRCLNCVCTATVLLGHKSQRESDHQVTYSEQHQFAASEQLSQTGVDSVTQTEPELAGSEHTHLTHQRAEAGLEGLLLILVLSLVLICKYR